MRARKLGLPRLRLRSVCVRVFVSVCVCVKVCVNVRGLQVPRSNAARPQSRLFAAARRGRGHWGGAATILEREAEQSRLGATERAAAAAMNPE